MLGLQLNHVSKRGHCVVCDCWVICADFCPRPSLDGMALSLSVLSVGPSIRLTILTLYKSQYIITFIHIWCTPWLYHERKSCWFGLGHGILLTRWRRDKMADIFQATFPNAFSWIKFFSCKKLYEWYFLSVCPSVRPSVCHTFLTMLPSSHHHEIFRSYHQGPG